MIEQVQRLPVLVLITFRPDFLPPWRSQAHLTPLTLNRLSRTRGAALVTALIGGKRCLGGAERDPGEDRRGALFLEELTKTVLEAGLLKDEGERYALAAPLPTLAIPSTLRDSLMARLDRLGGAKEVLQVGAVIGREFSYTLLAAVIPLDEAELQDALRRLAGRVDLCAGAPPHASYIFKHALVRDAAYESLLKSRRKQLHAASPTSWSSTPREPSRPFPRCSPIISARREWSTRPWVLAQSRAAGGYALGDGRGRGAVQAWA